MTQIEGLFEEQQKSLQDVRDAIKAQQDTMDDHFQKISEVERELSTAQLEIQKLRAVELGNAIEDPFKRGNVARDRLNSIVRTIGNEGNGSQGSGGTDPGDAGTELR